MFGFLFVYLGSPKTVTMEDERLEIVGWLLLIAGFVRVIILIQ